VSKVVDITEISGVVVAAGVLVGVVYYVLDLRHQSSMRQTEIETRQANLFMQIYDHFYNEDFLNKLNEVIYRWEWKDFDDFWHKYGPSANAEAFAKWDSVGTYFKGIGVLLKKNLVDLDLVDELMGTSIRKYWEKTSPIVKEIRAQWPHSLEGVEYLYNELQKREQKLQQSKA
jgi:hypothetical protein